MEQRDRRFEDREFSGDHLMAAEFTECRFENCRFVEVGLESAVFDSCDFVNCTFRNLSFAGLRLQNAWFRECACIGVDWSEVRRAGRLFPLVKRLEGCMLKYNTFVKVKLPKLAVADSSLIDCAFQECDLTGGVFKNVDFQDTTFHGCVLAKADFRDARNYRINPEANRLSKAKFSLPEAVGLLHGLDIVIE